MLEIAILKNFDSGTYKAGVQLAGSLTTYFDDISVAKNISSSALVIGNYVIVAIPGGNPKDACVIAAWPQGSPGGGGGASTFLQLSDTPSSYSGQAGKSAVVNKGENALEFLARAKISTGDKTIYIDKDATGNNDGTSWENAFTSWAACKACLTGWIIAHDWVIKVRKGSTPYNEELDFDGFRVWGSLTVEAEYYWQGDCEANVGGAGEITDTGAFADVAIGDRVLVMDFNGANSRIQNQELCTVDDISDKPNRIGTDGALKPTTGWKYVIVRTVLSGNGLDNLFSFTSMKNITVKGFKLTDATNSNWCSIGYSDNVSLEALILETMGKGGYIFASKIYLRDIYLDVDLAGTYGFYASGVSYVYWYHGVISSPGYCAYLQGNCFWLVDGVYFENASYGNYLEINVGAYLIRSFIENTVSTGIKVSHNTAVRKYALTNNAATPEDPAGTTDGAYIG